MCKYRCISYCTLGHTAGPFRTSSFSNLQVYPIEVIPTKHSSRLRTIFTSRIPNTARPIAILQGLGPECFMSQLDTKSAFRNVPVHLSDWELLGMKWEGLYFFDIVLPFGLRSAPFLFDEFSSAREWIIRTKVNIPKVLPILDDFFFATSPPGSKRMTALCQILE